MLSTELLLLLTLTLGLVVGGAAELHRVTRGQLIETGADLQRSLRELRRESLSQLRPAPPLRRARKAEAAGRGYWLPVP